MFIIFGWNHKKVTSLGAVHYHQCAHCHNEDFWNLSKSSTYITFFFIPLIPYETSNLYCCPICNHGHKVNWDEFKFYKEIAEVNTAFLDGKLIEEARQEKLEIINTNLDLLLESKRLKYLEESKKWREKVAEKSNDELVKIVKYKSASYNPAFILAAEVELKSRNIEME